LQIDPLAPGTLSKLILGSSAAATGCRAILYSTTKPQRVTAAASAVTSSPDMETTARFRALVEEFRKAAA
jgi:D-threo-aldose 1-dehydrogenase